MIFYEEILREFQKKKVKYVLVGGVASNLLGALRSTYDLDLLVELSDTNLGKIVKVLKKYGYRVKQPVDPMGIADKRTRTDWIENKHLKAFNFYKDAEWKEIDLIIKSPVSFKEARKSAVCFKIGNLTLRVISIDNLIKMKKKTGRERDKLDIKELKKLKRMKKNV
jgi:predicted nucleotidyltransferase